MGALLDIETFDARSPETTCLYLSLCVVTHATARYILQDAHDHTLWEESSNQKLIPS